MVLLDWTRMGRNYCLAGAVLQPGALRIVRPLLARNRDAAERNSGWSHYLLDGHCRWDLFELVGAEPAPPEPPHLEDLWVHSLRPKRQSAAIEHRRQTLEATRVAAGEPL